MGSSGPRCDGEFLFHIIQIPLLRFIKSCSDGVIILRPGGAALGLAIVPHLTGVLTRAQPGEIGWSGFSAGPSGSLFLLYRMERRQQWPQLQKRKVNFHDSEPE